ncbi:MAG TPA: IS21 family transposase [Thermodesulfobacteriota bacterium]|nr:IS21 family transposase [Thermodesulfobacteriota bacterium]
MAGERLSMRKTKEVLRLHFENHLSARQIAASCSIARSTVSEYLRRAQRAGVRWPLPPDMDDAALDHRLFPPLVPVAPEQRQMPPMEILHRELKKKGVTLQLLWLEYKQQTPEGYQYSQFCELYRKWRKKLDVCLRQEYRAGEKLFVDFAGLTVPIHDAATGDVSQAQIFVAILGASDYTYVEATASQTLPDWIACHVHAFDFLGGVAEVLIPDNLKSGVTRACHYEPDINPTYNDLAQHYGCVVIPARVAKARDKAKVENAVLITERSILAPLRHHTFFSIPELNAAIHDKLQDLNNRRFQKLDTTRRALFESLDRPALKPLPSLPYEFAEWKKARVNIDYHIEVDRHFYSVPYQLAREQVDVRLTQHTVEVLFQNRRVASHPRRRQPGKFSTCREHMAKAHQTYLEWTPSRILHWAAQIGPHTEKLATHILDNKPHPQQGFRSCLGILRLAKQYSPQRLEAACARALRIGGYFYRSVESILKNGLDQQPPLLQSPPPSPSPQTHTNIRGKEYYN